MAKTGRFEHNYFSKTPKNIKKEVALFFKFISFKL